MSPQAMQQCIKDYFSALSNKDCDAWLATFANDGANHDPAGSPPNVGHVALRQYFLTVSASFASVEISADEFEMNAAGTIQTLWGFWDPTAMFAELNA